MIGHADRAAALRDYCVGLLVTDGRRSVEPMAAVMAPAQVCLRPSDRSCWRSLPAGVMNTQGNKAARVDVSAIKIVAAHLQVRLIDRAMQVFGAMGSPITCPADLWTWGRALRLIDGPDEVHLCVVARYELKKAKEGRGHNLPFFRTRKSHSTRSV